MPHCVSQCYVDSTFYVLVCIGLCFLQDLNFIEQVDGNAVSGLREGVLGNCIGITAAVWPEDPPEASSDLPNKNLDCLTQHLEEQ